MEHIRQFDWCFSQPDVYFLKEEEMAHSVTEKILCNRFRDPMISSDSEDEGATINWDEIFTKKQNFEKFHRLFVPGLNPCPPYLKLSAINGRHHYQCLKVLCADNPCVLPEEFIPRPTKTDHRTYEELKETYEKEQKEYIEWAKTLWTNSHCIRALRPKPHIETVYEARFKMRTNEMQSYPKMFEMAAQIPLETSNNNFSFILDKELKNVNLKALPQIECRPIKQKLSIIRACSVPEPCSKHPCKFILPTERSLTMLPLTQVQRELAQYAFDNGAQYIASENALKCLLELDRPWNISVCVAAVIGPDGDTSNVVVLGSEFSIHRESVLVRTYKAFRHLLQHTLIPPTEKAKLNYKDPDYMQDEGIGEVNMSTDNMEVSSDEEEDGLCIDVSEGIQTLFSSECNAVLENKKENTASKSSKQTEQMEEHAIDLDNCSCKDTIYERPPPRSYRRWRLTDNSSGESLAVIVHSAHRVRDKNGEVILEPIPEYQLDLGGSAQSQEKIRSLALSLYLRKNASLMNVRIDGDTGEVATFEGATGEEFRKKHGDLTGEVANFLYTTISQLHGLLPGKYILRHKPTHGHNALLYADQPARRAPLALQFDCTQLAEADEAKSLKTAPTLVPVLLPFHKFRKILPCAFTPHEHQLPREPRRAPQRHRTPPRALQWPKRKKKKGKK